MKKVIVVCRNLLDSSRITESLSKNDIEYSKYSGLGKLVDAIDGNSGELTLLIDYSLFASPDDIIELVPNVDDENITAVIFGPHELMAELQNYYPSITFVARSIFFRNIEKWV